MGILRIGLVSCIIIFMSGFAKAQHQSSFVDPLVIILPGEYLSPVHFGPHVFNQSIDNWLGYRFGIGLRIYGRVEVLYARDWMFGTLVDRRYVAFASMPFKTNNVQFRMSVLKTGRFTYVYPELSFGKMQANLQGELSGDVFEIANNLSFDASDRIKMIVRVAYQRINFDVKTNPQFESLFRLSHGFIPSIGIIMSTQSYPEIPIK